MRFIKKTSAVLPVVSCGSCMYKGKYFFNQREKCNECTSEILDITENVNNGTIHEKCRLPKEP